MPKLSIIVPVYNVEKYLRVCIDSILIQSYKDWELLLIDDGTPDNSGIICDEYAQKDPRVRVFHKQNGGVSSARNLGLDNAKGEWVTFIDADDFISPTFIEALMKPTIDHPDLDLVHAGCTNWKNGALAGINQLYEDYIGTEPDIVFEKFRGLTVSKLFRLENVNHWSDGLPLRFDEKMKIAEDMVFTLEYMKTVSNYAFLEESGYYYRKDNESSATTARKIVPFSETKYSHDRVIKAAFDYANNNNINICNLPLRRRALAKTSGSMIVALYRNHKMGELKKAVCTYMLPEEIKLLQFYPAKGICADIIRRSAMNGCINNMITALIFKITIDSTKNKLIGFFKR